MAEPAARRNRRQEILEALASELESHPGARITTARLAHVLGVSEAALYRHFPSKARMFEGLLDFAEETVFGLVARVAAEEGGPARKVERIVSVVLTFAERNPGITRVLLGEALLGEHERLRARSAQFFERIETQIRQLLREAELGPRRPRTGAAVAASLVGAVVEGRLARYSRTGFRRRPTEGWDREWAALAPCLEPAPP